MNGAAKKVFITGGCLFGWGLIWIVALGGNMVFGIPVALIVMGLPFIAGIMLLVVGFIMLAIGGGKNKLEKLANIYRSMMGNNSSIFIEQLAASTQKDYNVVVSELEQIIRGGHIRNAHIDYSRKELVVISATPSFNAPGIAVACGSCGNETKIVQGTSKQCEFCGILIVR